MSDSGINKNVNVDEEQPPEDVSSQEEKENELVDNLYLAKHSKASTMKSFLLSGLLRNMTNISRINLYASSHWSVLPEVNASMMPQNLREGLKQSLQTMMTYEFKQTIDNDVSVEKFPVNVTSLMNESQLWGCFYLFPELYEDSYSPIVKIRTPEELEEPTKGGVLTKDLIATCLSYPARSPITGGYVYIKLNLALRGLQDISALQHYRFLQYLDMSSNLLTDLRILSDLPYLQYLSVAYNRLGNVLDYETPQWFLTEVHYRYNSVKKIRDLTPFWSIAVLDLSHNNIKTITGLHNLRYLRRLDLSFNHIQCLENLNHLRLTWLDVSYNNISSFEYGPQVGLWTLLHLEYLDINENQLTSLKIFSGCSRLRELHSRNNRLSSVLELTVYMKKLRNLTILDFRENPICSAVTYKTVVFNNLPSLLRLDDAPLDPVEQMTHKVQMTPDMMTHASRRLLRLLYVEQLSKARVSRHLPPADTTEVPIIVIVGPEASRKGTLCRRLAKEYGHKVKHALLHTTATHHTPSHYHEVTHDKMDDMMVAGELLTYSEMHGESYGLSREEAFISDGRVTIACMDPLSALMLRLRCRRPYLILASSEDTRRLNHRQDERKRAKSIAATISPQLEISTLQVLVSGRIEVAGILHEIIMSLPEEKEQSDFIMASECSLSVESAHFNKLQKNTARTEGKSKVILGEGQSNEGKGGDEKDKDGSQKNSLYSLYKQSQGTSCYDNGSGVDGQHSTERSDTSRKSQKEFKGHGGINAAGSNRLDEVVFGEANLSTPQMSMAAQGRTIGTEGAQDSSVMWRHKSVEFSRHTSSSPRKGCSGVIPESAKSVKSVAFVAGADFNSTQEKLNNEHLDRLTGIYVEKNESRDVLGTSISAKLPPWLADKPTSGSGASQDDLWFNFMQEAGLLQLGDETQGSSELLALNEYPSTSDKTSHLLLKDIDKGLPYVFKDLGSSIRDDCESLHRKCPGIFWDTLNTDDIDGAYKKLKRIVKDIVNSQSNLKPMFDLDFKGMDCGIVRDRLKRFQKEICPKRLFL